VTEHLNTDQFLLTKCFALVAYFAWFAWATLCAEIAKTATSKERKTHSRITFSCVLSNMRTFALTQM